MMKRSLFAGMMLVAAEMAFGASGAGETDALRVKARAAVEKGTAWLLKNQRTDGTWSETNMPALTGLPLWALARSGNAKTAPAIDRAVAFLLRCQNPDGGIYVANHDRPGGGIGNYNTCVCAAALYATGRKDLLPAVLKARSYIAASQHLGDDMHNGGFGYDVAAKRPYTDLNNTLFAIDAMRLTQGAEDFRPAGQKHADINWDAALKYVSSMQVKEGSTAGGFNYNRKSPKGGLETNATGRVTIRASGSMTYAGLLSLLHANLGRGDPRVREAIGYATRFWTVDENPGQGQQGLYFYLDVMARALDASGLDAIPRTGSEIRWRDEILRKVVTLQTADGFWQNANNRWWENDPVLATSYSLLALECALGR